jgi:hypothetical protein
MIAITYFVVLILTTGSMIVFVLIVGAGTAQSV